MKADNPLRLKAPSREDIESQIPFPIEKNADKRFSYKFLDWEWEVEPEYDEEGELVKEGVKSDHVLADLNVYDDTEIEFSDPVEALEGIETPMHGWT